MSLREQLRAVSASETTASNPFYATKSQPPSLCLEPTAGMIWMLPWHNFVSSCYEAGDPDRLVLTFAAQEATVLGRNLGMLIPAVANLRVEWLRAAPEKYLKAVGQEPSIAQISVRPLADPAMTV
jgi:hypothetical protein